MSCGNIQLFANCTCSLRRARILDADNLDQVNNSAEVVLVILLAREAVYLDRDSRVRLLL